MFSTVLLSQVILTLFCQAFCFELTEKDLKCFNDYDTEMKCSLHLRSCSGYKLNITHTGNDVFQKMYACVFESNCECKIEVGGFVLTETFNITLLKGANVLLSKTLQTEEFIKPKSPDLSVHKTENGNFIVSWDDHYERGQEYLRIHLTYGIKGGHKNISETEENIVGSFKIVSQNLQPNTNYILTATMSTSCNNHSISSDQSKPVYFTTPSSPCETAKMMIPPLCLGLIVIICPIFFCILRIKTNWWDKISKPKIDANLGEEKGHIFPSSVMKFSPIHVEIPTLDLQEDDVGADEKCIIQNPITCTYPLYPFMPNGSATPSDEGHRAFQGLTKSTERQWSKSISTEQTLKALKFPQSTGQDPTSVQQSSWATSLHFSPVIQMDSSYLCV